MAMAVEKAASAQADTQLYVYSNMDYNAKVGGWGVTVISKNGKTVYNGSESNSSDNQLVLAGCARVLS